jgi:GTP cyclohydrolase I
VRVVSGYLADLVRQYVGGDAHHMRQRFPRVVLNSHGTFEGFLDGYADGDGFRMKNRSARTIVSANTAFLTDLATVIGARFTPRTETASALYVADSWMRKHGFKAEYAENSKLIESQWVKVLDVRPVLAEGKKPFTVYSYRCDPHPTFLISGHLTHNCEHHLVPFFGVAHVGYIPSEDGRITGLSKLARLVDVFARRPQVQERLTTLVADSLMRILQPRGAIVVVECEHLCMSMRGIRKPGALTVTSAVRGQLRDPTTRAEAMSLIVARR